MIYIDHRPGTNGEWLEYVCNKWLGDTPAKGNYPDICWDQEYIKNKKFRADTYTIHRLDTLEGLGMDMTKSTGFTNVTYLRDVPVVRLTIDVDDILPVMCTMLDTPQFSGCSPENLETDTFLKLNCQQHKPVLKGIQEYLNSDDGVSAYNGFKAEHWPDIESYSDFLKLPEEIQQECLENGINFYTELSETNTDCPRWILRDYFRSHFEAKDDHKFLVQQKATVFDESCRVHNFTYKQLQSYGTFRQAIREISDYTKMPVVGLGLLEEYSNFIKGVRYLNAHDECEQLISDIMAGINIAPVNVIYEAYIQTRLEELLDRNLTTTENDFTRVLAEV